MKVKSGFILREIAGEYIIVPTGRAAIDFNGLITVNEVGKFIWDELQKEISEDELVERILNEYETDKETASADVKEFLETLKASEIMEN